jgi:signal transduction histidine kinase
MQLLSLIDPSADWSRDRRLQQIVWNLLSNAVKFTSGRHRENDSAASRLEIQILVKDSGQGIAETFCLMYSNASDRQTAR